MLLKILLFRVNYLSNPFKDSKTLDSQENTFVEEVAEAEMLLFASKS